MSVKVALEHRTTYEFARPVDGGAARGAAAAGAALPDADRGVLARGHARRTHFLNWQQDPFGNWLARLVFPEKIDQLDDHRRPGRRPDGDQPVRLLHRGVRRALPVRLRAEPGRRPGAVPAAGRRQRARPRAWTAALPPLPADGVPTVQFLADLNAAVNRDVAYDVRMEPGVQTPDETLQRARSARAATARGCWSACCGSTAWPPGSSPATSCSSPGPDVTEAPRRAERPEAGLHRPARLGRGLRPRRRLGRHGPDQRAVRRRGPHPAQRHAAPEQRRADRGRHRAGRGDVLLPQRGDAGSTRTRGSPSPTTDEQWARIDALGEAVDERLAAGDVRLTMGGEPTFVSLDDTTSAEWNTDADGPEQARARQRPRRPAAADVRRGRGRAPRPGQVVPGRAAAALEHRAPVAHRRRAAVARPGAASPTRWDEAAADPRRAANGRGAGPRGHRGARLPDEQLLAGLRGPVRRAGRRGRACRRAQPGADDDGSTPTSPSSTPTRQRADRLGAAARRPARSWTSPAWRFRRGRLVLTPGTSAVGLRLPLDSIAWEDPEYAGEPSYLEAGPPLDPQRPDGDRRRPGGRADRPRWPSRRATGTCTSSCRRPSGSRTTPTCSGWSRSRRATPAARSCSRATARRRTRGSPSSSSPPTPASSRSTCSRPRAGPSSAT